MHSLSWAPLPADYDAVEHHDSSIMNYWTIDGDYIHRNFGLINKVHVVQDSDEVMLVSWALLSGREQSLSPKHQFTRPLLGNWMKGLTLYRTLSNPCFDPLKHQLFTRPVYWHSHDLNQRRWGAIEKKARSIIRKYGLRKESSNQVAQSTEMLQTLAEKGLLGGVIRHSIQSSEIHRILADKSIWGGIRLAIVSSIGHVKPALLTFRGQIRYSSTAFLYYWVMRWHVIRLALQAAKGDPEARKRIRFSYRVVMNGIAGRPMGDD